MAQILAQIPNVREEFLGLATDADSQPDPELADAIGRLRERLIPHYRECIDRQDLPKEVVASLADYVARIKPQPERAWFVESAWKLVNPNIDPPLSLIACVELRYLSVLILDDIADESGTRCQYPTLHVSTSLPKAMYLSEVLGGIALEELERAARGIGLGRDKILRLMREWAKNHNRVNAGQFRDFYLEDRPLDAVSPSDAVDLIELTTAVEVANCFAIGAIGAGASDELIEELKRCGLLIGLLMQIRDDLLDYVTDETRINKEVLIDLKRRKKKLPLVLAYRYGTHEARETLEFACQAPEAIPLEKMRELIVSPEVMTHVARLAESYHAEALNILRVFDGDPTAVDLERFVTKYLVI